MITNKQILILADEFLEEWEADEDGRTWTEYSGTSQQLIEFALKIHEMGYNDGYDAGWESRAESEYTNSGLVGDPQ